MHFFKKVEIESGQDRILLEKEEGMLWVQEWHFIDP